MNKQKKNYGRRLVHLILLQCPSRHAPSDRVRPSKSFPGHDKGSTKEATKEIASLLLFSLTHEVRCGEVQYSNRSPISAPSYPRPPRSLLASGASSYPSRSGTRPPSVVARKSCIAWLHLSPANSCWILKQSLAHPVSHHTPLTEPSAGFQWGQHLKKCSRDWARYGHHQHMANGRFLIHAR